MARQRDLSLLGAVLNASVIVSGHLSSRGAAAEVINHWRKFYDFQLITSGAILKETTRSMLAKGVSPEAITEYLMAVALSAVVTEDLYIVEAVPTDPSDNIYLAAGLEGQADYIVSFDSDLLALKHYHSIQIVEPKTFLAVLRGKKPQ